MPRLAVRSNLHTSILKVPAISYMPALALRAIVGIQCFSVYIPSFGVYAGALGLAFCRTTDFALARPTIPATARIHKNSVFAEIRAVPRAIYRSTAIATAFPPPKHSAAIPR
jgi:hypothetical protein